MPPESCPSADSATYWRLWANTDDGRCWKHCEPARREDGPHVREALPELIRKNPRPRQSGGRGRPPAHSGEKTGFGRLRMMAWGCTFHHTAAELGQMRDVWDEPAPDLPPLLTRHMQTISSGAGTDRYGNVERPGAGMQDFVMVRARTYTKCHATAVPGHRIIPAAPCTPGNAADTTVLPEMPGLVGRHGPGMPGRLPRADRGYGPDRNRARACEAWAVPSIKQRKNRASMDKPRGRRAARAYGAGEHGNRGMCGGIFGAGEARGTGCAAGSPGGGTTGGGSPRAGPLRGTCGSWDSLCAPAAWECAYPPTEGLHAHRASGHPTRHGTDVVRQSGHRRGIRRTGRGQDSENYAPAPVTGA